MPALQTFSPAAYFGMIGIGVNHAAVDVMADRAVHSVRQLRLAKFCSGCKTPM
jgi:hypothetical protein